MTAIVATLVAGMIAVPVLSLLVIIVWEWIDRAELDAPWRVLHDLKCKHCSKHWDYCQCWQEDFDSMN